MTAQELLTELLKVIDSYLLPDEKGIKKKGGREKPLLFFSLGLPQIIRMESQTLCRVRR